MATLEENVKETLEYIKKLESENKRMRNTLTEVRSQLYDANNCDTVLTYAIDITLNK